MKWLIGCTKRGLIKNTFVQYPDADDLPEAIVIAPSSSAGDFLEKIKELQLAVKNGDWEKFSYELNNLPHFIEFDYLFAFSDYYKMRFLKPVFGAERSEEVIPIILGIYWGYVNPFEVNWWDKSEVLSLAKEMNEQKINLSLKFKTYRGEDGFILTLKNVLLKDLANEVFIHENAYKALKIAGLCEDCEDIDDMEYVIEPSFAEVVSTDAPVKEVIEGVRQACRESGFPPLSFMWPSLSFKGDLPDFRERLKEAAGVSPEKAMAELKEIESAFKGFVEKLPFGEDFKHLIEDVEREFEQKEREEEDKGKERNESPQGPEL